MEPKSNQNGTLAVANENSGMPSITLKNIPEDLYQALKSSAHMHRRSINSEAIYCLENSLLPKRYSREEIIQEIDEMRAEIGENVALSPEELEAAIEEGRE